MSKGNAARKGVD